MIQLFLLVPNAADPGSLTSTDEGTPEQEITEEEIPLGEVDIDDEEVPKGTVNNSTSGAPQLPKTGENSPLPLYLSGIGLITIGFVMNRVFRRRGKTE